MTTEITPTDKRPLGLLAIILLTFSTVPMNIWDMLSGTTDSYVMSASFAIVLGAIAVGLWYRNELARRALIAVLGLFIFVNVFSLFALFEGVDKGVVSTADVILAIGGTLLLVVILLYLRSDRVLRYYWANELAKENT